MKFKTLEKIKMKLRSRQITDTHALAWEVVSRDSELAKEQRNIFINFLEAQGYIGTDIFILKKNKKDIVAKTLPLIQERLTDIKHINSQEVELDKEIYTLDLLLHTATQYTNK